MFDQLFGRYLVASNRLSKDQFEQIKEKQDLIRVRLGLIAVNEKYMTLDQVEEVNHLQAIMDKRFGDIAIEKEYLTEDQLNTLLSLQGNAYQAFIQLLVDYQYMTMDEIMDSLQIFQTLNHFSDQDMEALKSCDVDQILNVYAKVDDLKHDELIGILVRTMIRLIDSKLVIGNMSVVNSILVDYYAEQNLVGDFHISLVFCGEGENLIPIANTFAGENFDQIDEDTLDAVCEFINCVNGLYATSLSYRNIDVNMEPPQFDMNSKKIMGKEIYIVPIYLKNTSLQVAIVINES